MKPITTIDLSGPDGNAMYLVGTARRLCKRHGMDENTIMSELRSGSYDTLVDGFEKYFSKFVTLKNRPEKVEVGHVYFVTISKTYRVESEGHLSDRDILSDNKGKWSIAHESSNIDEIKQA